LSDLELSMGKGEGRSLPGKKGKNSVEISGIHGTQRECRPEEGGGFLGGGVWGLVGRKGGAIKDIRTSVRPVFERCGRGRRRGVRADDEKNHKS